MFGFGAEKGVAGSLSAMKAALAAAVLQARSRTRLRTRFKARLAQKPAQGQSQAQGNTLQSQPADREFVPPGHFYSAIPCLAKIRQQESRIFNSLPRSIPGVEMNEAEQLALLKKFVPYYHSMPFPAHREEGLRYYFENPAYAYSDAILLHCMIRHLQPSRIIEIGSGFSSCVSLDTNELFCDQGIELTFIDPHPGLLLSLARPQEKETLNIIPQRLQDVDPAVFSSLETGDILFIDSTHVSKVDSDVNRIFFEILPSLPAGVYIHFHDVFYPFEYPREWVYEGRCWNEMYMLRTFLQFNSCFRIKLMNTFMETFHEDFFNEHMPLCMKNPGGSIWLEKV